MSRCIFLFFLFFLSAHFFSVSQVYSGIVLNQDIFRGLIPVSVMESISASGAKKSRVFSFSNNFYRHESCRHLIGIGALSFVTLSLIKARFFLKNLKEVPKAAPGSSVVIRAIFNNFINCKEILLIQDR